MRASPRPALLALLLASASAACRSQPPEPSILDVEMEQYRGDREERRLDDLRARTEKARAEADRLEAELRANETAIRDKREKVAASAKKALGLPPPLRIVEQPDAPSPAK